MRNDILMADNVLIVCRLDYIFYLTSALTIQSIFDP